MTVIAFPTNYTPEPTFYGASYDVSLDDYREGEINIIPTPAGLLIHLYEGNKIINERFIPVYGILDLFEEE